MGNMELPSSPKGRSEGNAWMNDDRSFSSAPPPPPQDFRQAVERMRSYGVGPCRDPPSTMDRPRPTSVLDSPYPSARRDVRPGATNSFHSPQMSGRGPQYQASAPTAFAASVNMPSATGAMNASGYASSMGRQSKRVQI